MPNYAFMHDALVDAIRRNDDAFFHGCLRPGQIGIIYIILLMIDVHPFRNAKLILSQKMVK